MREQVSGGRRIPERVEPSAAPRVLPSNPTLKEATYERRFPEGGR